MSYKKVNPNTGELETRYTLKEKYEYYKKKANNPNGKNKQGNKVDFTGRVALANRAIRTRNKMGRNKAQYDYYNSGK